MLTTGKVREAAIEIHSERGFDGRNSIPDRNVSHFSRNPHVHRYSVSMSMEWLFEPFPLGPRHSD